MPSLTRRVFVCGIAALPLTRFRPMSPQQQFRRSLLAAFNAVKPPDATLSCDYINDDLGERWVFGFASKFKTHRSWDSVPVQCASDPRYDSAWIKWTAECLARSFQQYGEMLQRGEV